jgi:hypothetical protein
MGRHSRERGNPATLLERRAAPIVVITAVDGV